MNQSEINISLLSQVADGCLIVIGIISLIVIVGSLLNEYLDSKKDGPGEQPE